MGQLHSTACTALPGLVHVHEGDAAAAPRRGGVREEQPVREVVPHGPPRGRGGVAAAGLLGGIHSCHTGALVRLHQDSLQMSSHQYTHTHTHTHTHTAHTHTLRINRFWHEAKQKKKHVEIVVLRNTLFVCYSPCPPPCPRCARPAGSS
jgi:hypothetical protein